VCDPTGVVQGKPPQVEGVCVWLMDAALLCSLPPLVPQCKREMWSPGQRVLELSTTRVALTTSAKEVNGLKRVYRQQATGTLKEEEEGPVRLCYGTPSHTREENSVVTPLL